MRKLHEMKEVHEGAQRVKGNSRRDRVKIREERNE